MKSNKKKLKCALGVCTPKTMKINKQLKIKICAACGKILEENWCVRWRVARNKNTPVEILKELAKDKDWYVRRALL